MSSDEPLSGTGTYCRVPVLHLSPAELDLLRTVLGTGGTRFAIVRGEVVAPREHEPEVRSAVLWARGLPEGAADEDDDLESVRDPLVKPPRGPLPDGRYEGTRWRRLAAGLLDEVLVGGPVVLSGWAGSSAWALALLHFFYTAVPMLGWGWTIGKLCFGLRVIDRQSQRMPSPTAVFVRWLIAAAPLLGGVFGVLHGDVIGLVALCVYAPVLVNLRGVHDMVAGTAVVERYPR